MSFLNGTLYYKFVMILGRTYICEICPGVKFVIFVCVCEYNSSVYMISNFEDRFTKWTLYM